MNLKRIKHSLKEKVGIQIRRKTLAAGVGYTTSNLLLKGVAFLSIPIFTRLLVSCEYIYQRDNRRIKVSVFS